MSRHGYDPETKQYTVPVPNDPYAEGKLSPAQWGELVRQASPGVTRYPAVLFIHGVDSDGVMEPFPEACDGDRTLHPDNLRDEVAQWTDVHGTDPSADEVESGFGGNPQLTRRAYKRGADTVVETFTLQGLGHFVPVEPGEGPRQGGHANPGAPHYTQAVSGFHSTYWTARFFALVP